MRLNAVVIFMNKKLYARRDRNGGLTISIPLALIVFLFTVMMVIISASTTYGALDNRVKNLETYFAVAGPEHTQIIDVMNAKITELEKNHATVTVKLDSIQRDTQEIKTNVKEVQVELHKHLEDS